MRLPLFPLHTVLFPGGMLPLRVFEQRYVAMTKACLRDETPFGVCLIERGSEVARAGERPAFATIGTLAHIAAWDMPELGILHLTARGGARFRVESVEWTKEGLAIAEAAPLAPEPKAALGAAHAPLRTLLDMVAARVGPEVFPAERDFDDASFVGYRLAELLPLPLPAKQAMLEVNDALVRLSVLQRFLLEQGVITA